jgi:RNA polymerase sigma-70 factor (ECF subfamily)
VEAFEVLYRQHVGRVHALCRRMAPAEADELTQRAFVKAWEGLPSFQQRSAFGTWLHRLAVNVVLTEQRAASRRQARVIAFEHPGGSQPPPPVADRLDLERAIATLPERARQVFVLHDIEGYKHREIAGFMGISDGTSKGQLHRARRLLREALTA